MKILVLAPHPFFQARGTPLAVRRVVEFLSSRGHQLDLLTLHEGEDVAIPNCRIYRIARPFGIRNIRPGFSFKKVICDVFMFAKCLRMVRRNRYDLIHAVAGQVDHGLKLRCDSRQDESKMASFENRSGMYILVHEHRRRRKSSFAGRPHVNLERN